jgi:hypothetical protein
MTEYFNILSHVVFVCVKGWACEITAWCEVFCVSQERTGVLAWAEVIGLCVEYLGFLLGVAFFFCSRLFVVLDLTTYYTKKFCV